RARAESEGDVPASRVLIRGGPLPPDTIREDPAERTTLPGPSRSRIPNPESAPALSLRDLRASRSRLLGSILLETGKITPAQLKSALARQSSELLYEILRWKKGRFDFRVPASDETDPSEKLGLSVAAVVMEGFRRVDEWRILERTLG